MRAEPGHPSLIIHTDGQTGVQIVLAAGRSRRPDVHVPWRRLPQGSLSHALDLVLEAARRHPAYAYALGGATADAEGALARCLRRAELEGFAVGTEDRGHPAGLVPA